MATIALFFALAGGSYAAVKGIPGKGGVISGCFETKTGDLRVVKEGKKCKRKETALTWNQKGVTGAPGAAGSNASVNGVAAGGSLSGSYPNPSLTAGSVGTSQFGTIPAARISRNVAETVSDNTNVALTLNVELLDTDDMYSSGMPTRLTVRTPGVYIVTGTVDWSSAGQGNGRRETRITVNGNDIIARVTQNATSTIDTEQNLTTVRKLEVGDFLTLGVAQVTGGSLNVNGFADETPVLAASWIGPG